METSYRVYRLVPDGKRTRAILVSTHVDEFAALCDAAVASERASVRVNRVVGGLDDPAPVGRYVAGQRLDS
jgi:hypothetical protein